MYLEDLKRKLRSHSYAVIVYNVFVCVQFAGENSIILLMRTAQCCMPTTSSITIADTLQEMLFNSRRIFIK